MRLTALALSLFVLSAAGCGAGVSPFDVTVTNVGDRTTYIHAGEGSGLLIGIEEEINGEFRGLSRSLAFMCMARCGDISGSITCADVAAELLVSHALLPGDSASKSFDGEFWYATDRGCARRAPLTGNLRVNLCHDDAIVDQNGTPVDEPSASGPVGTGSAQVMLESPNCEVFPIELEPEPGASVEIDEG